MTKEIKYQGVRLFKVKFDDINRDEELCTIDNIRRDEYGLYNNEGEIFLVGMLDTIDIVELLTTGIIERPEMTVEPLK